MSPTPAWLALLALMPPATHVDTSGDPLPHEALYRIGNVRLQHGAPVVSLAFSPDGKRLASAARDGTIDLHDSATGRTLRHLRFDGVRAVAFSPDGSTLAAGSDLGVVAMWDPTTGTLRLRDEERRKRILCLAYGPDGKALAVGGEDRVVCIWKLGDKLRPLSASEHPDEVVSIAFTPDGKRYLAAASSDTLDLRFVATGGKTWTTRLPSDVGCVAALADGKTLLAGLADGNLCLLDAATGKIVDTLHGGQHAILALAVSGDGKTIAAADAGGSVVLWRERKRERILKDILGEWPAVALSADGKVLATSAPGHRVELRDTATGKLLPIVPPRQPDVTGVSASERFLAVGRGDGTAIVHDAATGKELRRLGRPGPEAARVVFLPGGDTLAWAAGTDAHLVDATGKEVRKVALESAALALSASRDGRLLAIACAGSDGRGEVHVRETTTGKAVFHTRGAAPGPGGLLLSPDGKVLIVVTADGEPTLWDVARQRKFPSQPEEGLIGPAAWSPDGRTLALCDNHWAIHLFEVETGEPVRKLSGHADSIHAIAFSPDGRALLSAGADHTIRLWELRTGDEVLRLDEHQGSVNLLGFFPDGHRAWTAGADGTILARDVTGRRVLAEAPSDRELEQLWQTLASETGRAAYSAVWTLALADTKAVPFLRLRLSEYLSVDEARLAELIRQLNHNRFAMREKASAELEKHGRGAEQALRRARSDNPSPEQARRLVDLLARIERNHLAPELERLRLLRVLEVLEKTRTEPARALLRDLSRSSIPDEVRKEAAASLGRLGR